MYRLRSWGDDFVGETLEGCAHHFLIAVEHRRQSSQLLRTKFFTKCCERFARTEFGEQRKQRGVSKRVAQFNTP